MTFTIQHWLNAFHGFILQFTRIPLSEALCHNSFVASNSATMSMKNCQYKHLIEQTGMKIKVGLNRRFKFLFVPGIAFLLLSINISAQDLTQTIKGKIVDDDIQILSAREQQ
ncbi:MAG: hypothetical protein R2764_11555 [Bacteroidales bacterium]